MGTATSSRYLLTFSYVVVALGLWALFLIRTSCKVANRTAYYLATLAFTILGGIGGVAGVVSTVHAIVNGPS